MTRGGVYDEISPEGSGDISSYTLTLVTILSFSTTSTSEYFLVCGPPLKRRPNILSYTTCNIFSYCQFEDSVVAAVKVH